MSHPNRSAEALSKWSTNAAFWDESIGGEGNKYWKKLQLPSLQRLIGDMNKDSNVLELATGNGLVASWFKSLGATVLATDGSAEMLERAKERRANEDITWKLLDVTNQEHWQRFIEEEGDGRFDVVVMNMALMDVATLEPLADALPRVLKKGGIFIATLLHPIFWTSNASRVLEIIDNPITGEEEITRGRLIKEYLHVPPAFGDSVPGQPAKQIYFHRPLDELFAVFFKRGLVMDALEEPAFTEEDKQVSRVESLTNYTQLPALLSFRLRKM